MKYISILCNSRLCTAKVAHSNIYHKQNFLQGSRCPQRGSSPHHHNKFHHNQTDWSHIRRFEAERSQWREEDRRPPKIGQYRYALLDWWIYDWASVGRWDKFSWNAEKLKGAFLEIFYLNERPSSDYGQRKLYKCSHFRSCTRENLRRGTRGVSLVT